MKSLLLFGWLSLLVCCNGYRILFMGPFPAPSHWMWLENFQNALLRNGHQVTTVNNHPVKSSHVNLTEIIIDPKFDIPKHFPKDVIFEMRFASDFQNLQLWWNIGVLTSEHALRDRKVRALIADEDREFDVVIVEQFFHESFLLFGHKFRCPVITIGTMGYADNMDHAMGVLTPWSIVPHLLLSYTDEMTFVQRAYNAYLSLYDNFWRRWYYLPRMQAMAVEHFGKHIKGPFPAVQDLERNISLMLINSHRSVDSPRPSISGLIDVGGAHIKPAKPLSKDLQEFLDSSTQGVVYFSLGSYMKSTDLPPKKIQLLLTAFGQLKQKVLWKFENDTIGRLPANVMIKKWLPQNDILAHPNVKVFITHGGIFGTQEGIHWAVPMLCMPLYGDQHRNTIKSVRGGYARSINFADLSVSGLVQDIHLLLHDPSYKAKALDVSRKFRDNLVHPLEEATFWIEYIARHKGAPHMKSQGAVMPFYKYLMLDLLGTGLLIGFAIVWVLWRLVQIVRGHLKKARTNSVVDGSTKKEN